VPQDQLTQERAAVNALWARVLGEAAPA